MKEVKFRAYAKINLGLDVIGKRKDGYHEVRMIMQTVNIYDKLTFRILPEDDIQIKTNLAFLPVDENNLIYKVIQLFKETYGIRQGVFVDLFKCIPVAAGMAGGSADCAAALKGMNQLFELGLSKKKLMEYGAKLGADVPYCIMQGTALSEGIGEILTPLSDMPHCHIVIAKPPVNVSTKFVYENLHLDTLKHHPDIDGMVQAIKDGSLQGIADTMENVLETVTIAEYPVIPEIKMLLRKQGALNTLMTGSGPTVFGLFLDEQAAQQAAQVIKEKELANQIYMTTPR